MSINAVDFADTYKQFLKTKDDLREFTLDLAEFFETTEVGQEKVKRRPIVLVQNGNARRSIESRVKKWTDARDKLHEASPERFPLNSALFDPAPTVLRDVKSAQMYINSAVSSRSVTAASIIKRLDKMLKSYLNKSERCKYEENIAQIESELEYFRAHEESKFRLRLDGYTEIVLFVKFSNDEEQRIKVHDGGLFLCAKEAKQPVTLLTPEQMPQAQIRQKRASIYDSIDPVQTCIPFNGKLYLVDDIIAAENEAARNEHRLAASKKRQASTKN